MTYTFAGYGDGDLRHEAHHQLERDLWLQCERLAELLEEGQRYPPEMDYFGRTWSQWANSVRDELDKCRVKEEPEGVKPLGRTRHTRQDHHDKIDEITTALNDILKRLKEGGL